MLRSKTFLLVCTALSTLAWVACSSGTATNPAENTDTSSDEAGVAEIEAASAPRVEDVQTVPVSWDASSGHSWTAAGVEDIRVGMHSLTPAAEGCVLEASVDGQLRDVRIAFDTDAGLFSVTSRNPGGEVVWAESYQVLGERRTGLEVTEIGPSGFGLRWAREQIGDRVWRESVSAVGLVTADLILEVNYDSPRSVADGEARLEAWLPHPVRSDVFHAFEGFAIRSILQEIQRSSLPVTAGLSQLISDEPAARDVVETVCMMGALCAAMKCTFGGGSANPVCVGCTGIVISCAICELFGWC